MDFKPIETQEAFDNMVKERLERNTKSVTQEVEKRYEGYISQADYEAKTKDFTSQIENLSTKVKENDTAIADLKAKNKAYELNSLKVKVANEYKIPFDLAGKLSGETEEELKKDAETLSKYVGKGKPHGAPFFSGEPAAHDKKDTKTALTSMLRDLKI